MTIKLQEALQAASAHAMRRGHQGIDVEHLIIALLEQQNGIAGSLLEHAGVSPSAAEKAAQQALAKIPQVHGPGTAPGQLHMTPRLSQALVQAEKEMQGLKDDYLSVEHVLLAMVEEGGLFKNLGITRAKLLPALQQVRGNQRVTSQDPEGSYLYRKFSVDPL